MTATAAVEDLPPPSPLIPGNFPFPAIDHGSRAAGAPLPGVVASGPSAPPPTYPPLPRGLKPFVEIEANSEEARELEFSRLIRMFFRRSAYYFGERDDEFEARARAGDVVRYGDDRRDEDDEDDATRAGDEDVVIDERWVRRMSKFKLSDFMVTDETIVPREILEAAFGDERTAPRRKRGAARDGDVEDDARGTKKRSKTNALSGTSNDPAGAGLSRLERLAQLEARNESGAEAEASTGVDGRGKSIASARENGAGMNGVETSDDDDDDGDAIDSDDELDSDDDYGAVADFDDDDDGWDDAGGADAGGGDDAFY